MAQWVKMKELEEDIDMCTTAPTSITNTTTPDQNNACALDFPLTTTSDNEDPLSGNDQSIPDVTTPAFSVPTPNTSKTTPALFAPNPKPSTSHYSPDHPNAKFRLLNLLNTNIMDRISGLMRSIKGGLFESDESWTELYHQKGHAFDMRLLNQSIEKRKTLVRAVEERRVNKLETQAALERIIVLETGKRKPIIVKETKVKSAKKEAREMH